MNCLACNEENSLKYLDEKLGVLYCTKCESLQLEKEFNERIHNLDYKNKISFFEKIKNKIIRIPMSKFAAKEYIRHLQSKTNFNFKNVLDIGANIGIFVNELNKLGIDAYGIEGDEKFVKLAITNKVKHSYFEVDFISHEKYDLICLTQVIYYVSDNYGLLKHVRNMLNENGLIFISMLNPSSEFVRKRIKQTGAIHTTNLMLSKKNFQNIHNKLGLKLIDYTTYSNYHTELYNTKFKIPVMLKYYFGIKKPYRRDLKGNHSFILLKKIN